MPAADAALLLSRFTRKVRQLDTVTTDAKRLFRQGRLKQQSLDAIYEGAFLGLYTSFESFIESLFYSCVLGQSGLIGVGGVVRVADRAQAEMLVRGQQRYVKWLPYAENVLDLGARWLVRGSPFGRMRGHDVEITALEDARVVRNAIAHESGSTSKAAARLVGAMRPYRRHPAGYLQHLRQGREEYERLALNFVQIAGALCGTDESAAHRGLSSIVRQSGAKVPQSGSWMCRICRVSRRINVIGVVLPECSRCGATNWEMAA